MDRTMFGMIVAIVGLLALMVYASIQDTRQWEQFKAANNCKAVAHIRGDVFNTITPTSNGVAVGVGSTPDKTGWQCSDGMTYYR